ncbi:FimV/HubP family polar landmark protein [Pseudidiomarina insulisalsae]|uniref:Pilus assembly protein FimV n=1 Tax=Pseudidiomarina insulisalsae TaxID=575789 RepID=A0A432YM55_9GAMM|nr:FimV/HubP family polar landmark protein [Pseudidiomarina insulisalsae]RUO61925.1 hypothetical protein CWI71_06110 [Pseudidiomarina insulisalsae]
MTRIILAATLAILVAYSGAVAAQQGARASRWQPERFGPIVKTDTMWSIAGYYGRQQGVSLYEMMDQIVAANPEAFRDNRPDFMYTGFFLDIPEVGEPTTTAQQPAAAVATPRETATTETERQPAAPAPTEDAVGTEVENEIAISVSELQALRGQLSSSIDLIENLQGENQELQQRLAAVTRELTELRARANAEQQASAEMELMAQELNSAESSAETVAESPDVRNPGQPDAAAESSAADETAADETAADETVASEPVITQPQTRQSPARSQSWLDWVLKPLHLTVLGGLLVIILGLLAYALYIRRVNREIENGDTATAADAATAAAVTETTAQETPEADETTQQQDDWRSEGATEGQVEVTDVDLDEYLREREDGGEADELSAAEDADEVTKEVDALLAMEFDSPEPEPEAAEPAEDVAEYRMPEPQPKSSEEKAADDELEQALDSFGGLRLDESATESEPKAAEDQELNEKQAKAVETDDVISEEDYLTIESLMEEAEAQASEEPEDPYDKDKLSEALGGDDGEAKEYDLSSEDLLDESKSPAAKLDLAQVYIDMGELDDARTLLESIAGSGDEEAERDAAELLQKLAEQGGR